MYRLPAYPSRVQVREDVGRRHAARKLEIVFLLLARTKVGRRHGGDPPERNGP